MLRTGRKKSYWNPCCCIPSVYLCRPDMTVTVDWVLNNNYLSIRLFVCVCARTCVCCVRGMYYALYTFYVYICKLDIFDVLTLLMRYCGI